MFQFGDPDVVTQELNYDDKEKLINFKDTSRTIVEIWKGGDDPESSVPLDHDSKKYLRINLK